MKKFILLFIITIGVLGATEYRLVHLRKGTRLNVRAEPIISSRTAIGALPYNAMGIRIKECKYNRQGQEWCYINYPVGAGHIEGWVNRYYLRPMRGDSRSYIYIKNFLKNFYLADEENFLDKLKVYYRFPMQQYFNKRNVSLMQLRTLKVSFYKKWPKRKYRLTYLKILKKARSYIDVQTTIKWKFQNYMDSEEGKDIQKIRLVQDRNKRFKVLAIKTLRHTVYPKEEEILPENSEESNNSTIITNKDDIGGVKYYIKVGSFYSYPNRNYLNKIVQNGFNYIIQEALQNNNETIKRLYIGPYNTESEVVEKLQEVREKINPNAYIQSF
jgi:hypothetical protein